MDFSMLVWPLQALLGAFCTILWFMFVETRNRAEKVSSDLAAYKVEAAEKFSTKYEVRAAIEAMSKMIESQGTKIENRIDRLEARILDMNMRKDH